MRLPSWRVGQKDDHKEDHLIGTTSAELTQSSYTKGTITSDEAAGYPLPDGYRSGLYAYAPGYGNPRFTRGRQSRVRPKLLH
jgi:hypothetical protein